MIYKEINLNQYFNLNCQKGGKLIVYAHENNIEINLNRKYPAMLIFHGGGYIGKSFRESEPVALEYFVRGFNCFVLNYQLVPFTYDYAPLIEGAMAMKYIRENGNLYNLTDKVCVCGFSAGGHLASFLATAFDDEIYKDFFKGDIDGIRPDTAILCYPVISSDYLSKSKTLLTISGNNKAMLPRVSTEKRITKNTSPSFIWTTADDECVNPINSLLYAENCVKNNVKFSLHIFPSGKHGLSLGTDIVDKIGADLKKCENYKNWLEESCVFIKEQGIYLKD